MQRLRGSWDDNDYNYALSLVLIAGVGNDNLQACAESRPTSPSVFTSPRRELNTEDIEYVVWARMVLLLHVACSTAADDLSSHLTRGQHTRLWGYLHECRDLPNTEIGPYRSAFRFVDRLYPTTVAIHLDLPHGRTGWGRGMCSIARVPSRSLVLLLWLPQAQRSCPYY